MWGSYGTRFVTKIMLLTTSRPKLTMSRPKLTTSRSKLTTSRSRGGWNASRDQRFYMGNVHKNDKYESRGC